MILKYIVVECIGQIAKPIKLFFSEEIAIRAIIDIEKLFFYRLDIKAQNSIINNYGDCCLSPSEFFEIYAKITRYNLVSQRQCEGINNQIYKIRMIKNI